MLRYYNLPFLLRGSEKSMGQYTKQDAIRIVNSCALKYKENLSGKNLLFLCQNKHGCAKLLEFSFDANNFLHLTGLKLKERKEVQPISARKFYDMCLNHKLSPSDFEFAKDGTTQLKLEILPSLISKNLSAKMIGDYNSMNPKLMTDKIAGNTTACMGFVGTEPSGRFVPNTVLKLDIRDCITNQLRVVAVYRKEQSEDEYAEVTYRAKKIEWDKIQYPEAYRYLASLNPVPEVIG